MVHSFNEFTPLVEKDDTDIAKQVLNFFHHVN